MEFREFILVAAPCLALGCLLWLWHRQAGPHGRRLASLLLVGWSALAGWLALFYAYPQALDTHEERFFMSRLLKALADGPTSIPLRDLTGFRWTSVCWAEHLAYHEPPAREHAAVRAATGDDLTQAQALLGENDTLMIFGTPDGPRYLRPLWQRLDAHTQQLWHFRFYKKALHGRSFLITLQDAATGADINGGCHMPERAVLRIEARN